MFTGIIEEVGAVERLAGPEVRIRAKSVLEGVQLGDSIAVEGVCLTVTAYDAGGFAVQVSPETFSRTTLGRLRVGGGVNLERALAVGARMGGHFVQGHVDGVGQVVSVEDQGEFQFWRFRAPEEVAPYVIPKGSVAIDGISLTIVNPSADQFGVAIIPATLEKTTLGRKRSGDPVNMEADMIGKHVHHYMEHVAGGTMTEEFLSRHGFA
jgi:riboflavin synthase